MRPTPSGVSHPAVDSRSGDSYEFALSFQARSSVVEHYLDTVGVVGSKPIAPTIFPRQLERWPVGERAFAATPIPSRGIRHSPVGNRSLRR